MLVPVSNVCEQSSPVQKEPRHTPGGCLRVRGDVPRSFAQIQNANRADALLALRSAIFITTPDRVQWMTACGPFVVRAHERQMRIATFKVELAENSNTFDVGHLVADSIVNVLER